MTNDTIDTIRKLNPVRDEDVGRAIAPETKAQLIDRITADRLPTTEAPRRRIRRRLVPALMATGLAASAAVFLVDLPGDDTPRALSFTEQGNFLIVKILDLHADSERYNKEFKKRGLDIKLRLAPVSPASVGQNVAQGYEGPNTKSIETFDDPPGCSNAGSYPCVPSFKIPLNYKGTADLYIGRAAAPDERYAVHGSIGDRGEALHGVRWQNEPVGEVLKILKSRGHVVDKYFVGRDPGLPENPRQTVPDTWYVVHGTSWKPGHSYLWVVPKL